MKRTIIFLLLLVPELLFSQISIANKTASAETGITGRITDRSNGEAVIGAITYLAGTPYGAMTDVEGFFRFKCAPGKFTLRVQHVNYFTDSIRINIDSGYQYALNCVLRNQVADSTTINPVTGNIYGLTFTKKGRIDSAHSSFSSLDSIVAMMKEKPLKKISLLVGYRYEDGSFEPLNDDEFFIRMYLISHGIPNDRIIFGNVANGPVPHDQTINIINIRTGVKQKHHLIHRHPKAKKAKKGKGTIDVYWLDKSVTEVTIDIQLHYPR